jgi:hypothetical protein
MNLSSCKVKPEVLDFINKMKVNRIKTSNSEKIESNSDMFDLIVKFFKFNNSIYLKLLETKTEEKDG